MFGAQRDSLEFADEQILMQPITIVSKGSARAAYRVVPDPDDPVILLLDGEICRVLDISASGFSCGAADVTRGRRYSFQLDLPIAGNEIRGVVDVLTYSDDGELHCKFVDLGAHQLDQLHQYVLVRQKEAIRTLKNRRPSS